MRWSAVVAILLLTASCSHLPSTRDQIVAQGFRQSDMSHITVTGETRHTDDYELWFRQLEGPRGAMDFCLVSKKGPTVYQWRMTVFVDNAERWSYESVKQMSKIDCVTTPVLPEGRKTWRVWYNYYE